MAQGEPGHPGGCVRVCQCDEQASYIALWFHSCDRSDNRNSACHIKSNAVKYFIRNLRRIKTPHLTLSPTEGVGTGRCFQVSQPLGLSARSRSRVKPLESLICVSTRTQHACILVQCALRINPNKGEALTLRMHSCPNPENAFLTVPAIKRDPDQTCTSIHAKNNIAGRTMLLLSLKFLRSW